MSFFKSQFKYQPSLSPGLPSEKISPAAETRIQEILEVQKNLKVYLEKAQEKHKIYPDQK